jgi:hypothetical protein
MFEDEMPDPEKMTEEELAAFLSRPFETPLVPCELLGPVMCGVMAMELANMVLPSTNNSQNEKEMA